MDGLNHRKTGKDVVIIHIRAESQSNLLTFFDH